MYLRHFHKIQINTFFRSDEDLKKNVCLLSIMMLLLNSCSNFSAQEKNIPYNDSSTYDIYFNHVGNIGFIQVQSIEKGNIVYGKMKYMATKNDDKMIYKLVNSADNKVYASVRTPGSSKANRLIVLKKGEIQKEIVFKDNQKPAEIINDVEKNRVFVELTQINAIIGTPIRIVDYTTDEYYDCPFNIKGNIRGYGILGDYIYVAADTRIIKIDRNSLEMKIVSKEYLGSLPNDLGVSPNGKVYITTNGHVEMIDPDNRATTDFKTDDSLMIYDLNGNFQKKVELKKWCDQIIINKNGIAYISHKGKRTDNDYLGETLTIFDTNTDRIVKTIDGLYGITTMYLMDDYLFIYTSEKQSITIMDANTYEISGEIPIEYKGFCLSMTVLKTKNN